MVAKRFQNPEGGLNEAGRKHFKKTEGANLKKPQKSGTDGRRVSFAARFAGMKGPMKDEKGRPIALAVPGSRVSPEAKNRAGRWKTTAYLIKF